MISGQALDTRISQLFVSDLNLDVASPDTDLLEAGIMDSALAVEVLLVLEERFGVDIPIEELDVDDLRSIRSIAGLVARRTGG